MAVSANKVADMYADGMSLRQIGTRVSLSHEGVRKVLVANGTPLRVPGGGPGALPDLAKEILADLPVEFPRGTTIPLLCEWLGEQPEDVRRAVDRLVADRLVERRRHRYFAAENAAEAALPRPGSQLARVMDCLKHGPMTTAMVAERIGGRSASVAASLCHLERAGLVRGHKVNSNNAKSWSLVPKGGA